MVFGFVMTPLHCLSLLGCDSDHQINLFVCSSAGDSSAWPDKVNSTKGRLANPIHPSREVSGNNIPSQAEINKATASLPLQESQVRNLGGRS